MEYWKGEESGTSTMSDKSSWDIFQEMTLFDTGAFALFIYTWIFENRVSED